MTFPDFLIILFLSILIIIILFLYYELSKRIQKNIETFEEKNHDLKNTNTKIKKNHSELKNKIGKNKEITGLLESFNIELEEEISCLEEKICSLEKKNIGVKDRNEELVGGVSDAKCYMENIGLLKDHIETKWKGFNNLDVKVGVCEKSLKLFEGSNKELEDEILYLKEKIHDLEEKNEEVKLNLSNINLNDLKFQVLNANIMKKFSINTDNLKKNYVRFSHINALKKEVSAMNKLYDKILSISNYNLLKFSVKFIDDWNFYGYLINNFEDCNNEYVKNEIEINKNYFSNINNALNENEKISLDDDQRYSLVVNDDNNLIIAGAGSGKTLTIVSKIKYLIEKKHANPDEIFVFSFSNASVNDLKEKIKKLNIKNINHLNVSTFHKKGLDILKKNNFADERKLEKVANEGELDKVIDVFFFKALQNKDLVKKIIDFFVEIFPMNFQYPNSLAKLAEIQRNYDFETIKSKYKNKDKIQLTLKEEVRSVEELLIANFLFLNGIEYKYESLYDPLKTFNSIKTQGEWENEKYWVKKYKPTFFLPAYNIYLEHFGIDENEKVNWLSESGGKHYVKKMYDKRKIHEKYKTKLLETYSYFGNDLLEKLKEILIVNGVKLREIDYSILYEVLIENNNLNFDLKRLISSFIKLFKSSGFKEEKFLEFKDQNNEEEKSWLNKKNEFLLDIIHLIYVDYQKYLSSNKKIDFNDMINNASEIIKQKGTDEKYSYLIIDEFQDMSFARKEFIKAIQEKNGASVTVVGDDWQSIYRFAGSQLLLFTEFEKDFHNHQELFIRNNYRNPQNLINIATKFIEKNPDQIKKRIRSKNKNNVPKPVKFYYLPENKQSINILKRMIDDILKKFPHGNITILGRNNNDLERLYKYNELFYDLKIIYGKYIDKMHGNRLVNDIFALLNKYENKIYDHQLVIFTDISSILRKYEKIVNNQLDNDLLSLLKKYGDKIDDNQLLTDINSILRKYEKVHILVNDISKLLRKYEFYDKLIFDKEKEELQYQTQNNNIICINFSTIHRSKGLEYDNVILINLQNRRDGFPNKIEDDPILDFINTDSKLLFDEERRLFYVALTRARNTVYCMVPEINESIFITEIKEDSHNYIEEIYSEDSVLKNPLCPKCKEGRLLERNRSGDKFISCSNFPICDFSAPDVKYLKNMTICPECGEGILVDKKSKFENSKGWISCTNYTCGCENKYNNQKLDNLIRKCPDCKDGFLVEKKGRFGKFLGCTNYANKKCSHTENITNDSSYKNKNMPKIENVSFKEEFEDENDVLFVGDIYNEIEEINSLKNYIDAFNALLADVSDCEKNVELLEQSNTEIEKIINYLNKDICNFEKKIVHVEEENDNIAMNIIVNNESDIDTCKNIIGFVNNVDVLINIDNKTDNVVIREIIGNKIYEIAKSGNDINNRMKAINRIKNDKYNILEKITNDINKDVRITAVNRITDESVLINLSKTSKYEDVREIAEQILLSYSFKNNKKCNKINDKFDDIEDIIYFDVDTSKNDEIVGANDNAISVDMPDYSGDGDIGNNYDIPVFKEIISTFSSSSSLIKAIQEIISNEHPIHITRLSKLLLEYLKQEIVTENVENQIISEIKENKLGIIHDKFVYLGVSSNILLNTNLSIIPRIPNNRPIDHISQEELMEGMFIVADKSFNFTKKSLINETGRLFGFKHIENKISKFLDDVFTELLNSGRIIFEKDMIKTQSLKNYYEQIYELEKLYKSKKKIISEIINDYFPPQEKRHNKFINEFNRLNETFLKETNFALNTINTAPGHTKDVVHEIKERINEIKSLVEKIEYFTFELETVQKYEKIIKDLEVKFQEKEIITKKLIKEHFPPPQMTYDRFIDEIDNCNKIFYNQTKLVLNILDIVPGITKKAVNEFKKRLNNIESLVKKMEEMVIELNINYDNSPDGFDDDKINESLEDMQKLISSVKEYT